MSFVCYTYHYIKHVCLSHEYLRCLMKLGFFLQVIDNNSAMGCFHPDTDGDSCYGSVVYVVPAAFLSDCVDYIFLCLLSFGFILFFC